MIFVTFRAERGPVFLSGAGPHRADRTGDDMTALRDALEGAGINQNENEFLGAIAKFLNNGGSIGRAERLLALAAKRMPDEGQKMNADEGHSPFANVRHLNGGAAGRRSAAEQGHTEVSRPSPESREPSATERKAAVTARRASAKAVLDLGWIGRDHIPGGPKYIDLRVMDIAGMAERQLSEGATHARSAIVLKMIEREIEKVGRPDPQALWVDVLSPATVKRIAAATEAETLKPMAVGWLRGFNNQVQKTVAGGANG